MPAMSQTAGNNTTTKNKMVFDLTLFNDEKKIQRTFAKLFLVRVKLPVEGC